MADVPQFFNQPGAAFVIIRDGEKFPPIGTEWQKKPHTFQEATAHEGNVGILAGNGYIGLDQDEPDAFKGLELVATTTWETRPGRLGMWFKCDDCTPELLAKYGKKADHAQLKLYKDGLSIGEVKLQRTYQVIPNSWKRLEDGKRADYKMLDSSAPATISLERLLADLQAIGITFSSKLEGVALKRYVESEESKNRRYAEAALRDEASILQSSSEGARNEQLNRSAFAMGQLVAAGALSEAEVISKLSEAASLTGLKQEEIRKTIESGLHAGAKNPREIPERQEDIGDLLEKILANPRAIKEPSTLKAMAAIKLNDPIEFDFLIDSIKKANKGLKVDTIRQMVEKSILESEQTVEETEIQADILAEANQILDEGRGFEYAYEVWQKRHHGDENLGKGLFLSIGAQSCISSKGIHIHACGPRGSGKSDGAEKASEAVPKNYLMVGSTSPKALYYLGERLPAGSVVYLDDIGWNDQAALMFKTCTTFYGEGATHTVVVDHEPREFKTAPRIIFWLTTADNNTDEQIRDRLLRIDTTETTTHTKEVIDFIFQQRKSGAASFDSREIEICRAIIYLLKQEFIDVVIPFSDNIRLEGDPRGATIFADLISAFAIWRYRIRELDSNGAVIACYEDYKDAETFFNAIKGHGDTKYTPGELRVLQAIKDLSGNATRETVMAKTGLSKGGLADILNGRNHDGQAKYGLLHKCPALTEEEVSTSTRTDDETKTSRRKRVYRLPGDYDIMEAYGKAVYLYDETNIKRAWSSSSDEFVDGSKIENKFDKDPVRKFEENDNIRERRMNEPEYVISHMDGVSHSLPSSKPCELTNLAAPTGGLPLPIEARTPANSVGTKPRDSNSNPAKYTGQINYAKRKSIFDF